MLLLTPLVTGSRQFPTTNLVSVKTIQEQEIPFPLQTLHLFQGEELLLRPIIAPFRDGSTDDNYLWSDAIYILLIRVKINVSWYNPLNFTLDFFGFFHDVNYGINLSSCKEKEKFLEYFRMIGIYRDIRKGN